MHMTTRMIMAQRLRLLILVKLGRIQGPGTSIDRLNACKPLTPRRQRSGQFFELCFDRRQLAA